MCVFLWPELGGTTPTPSPSRKGEGDDFVVLATTNVDD
jgi:hypothetical protein